jgi:putative ABC transport system permease protein
MNTFIQDVRFALRLLAKSPGLTAVAALALALGIGANSALFSVVNKVLLSPLPFKDPERLVMIWSTAIENKIDQSSVSGPDFIDWRKQNQSFEDLAAMSSGNRFNLTGRGEPIVVKGAYVTPSFFGVFGMRARLGRTLLPEEAQAGNEHRLVLSHGLWQRRFGSDPNVIGQTLTVNGEPYLVVGVMPPSIGFVEDLIEAYAPLPMTRLEQERMNHSLLAFGRLKPGVGLPQAQADLATICARLGQEYPDQKGWNIRLSLLHDELVKVVRPAFLVLHGAVGFVLLIACANVANLLLARAETRSKEMAIRASLGASRVRVIRQLLTESVLLSLAGGALGLIFARWGMALLRSLSPRFDGRSIPLFDEIGLDARVLGFTLLIALLTGLIFGLVPALHASKPNLAETLKEGGRGAGVGFRRHRLLSGFVVSEVALSMVLLVGAGLMIRNFHRLSQVNPGFDPRNLLVMEMELPDARYAQGSTRVNFYREVVERVAALPGVESVGLVNIAPMCNNNCNNAFDIDGAPPLPKGRYNLAEYRVVNHDYFRALRIPVKQGRLFTPQDNGQGQQVVIINETMAKRYFPNENPLHRRLKFGYESTNTLEIVGVVGDEKHFGLGHENPPMMYQPYFQNCWNLMWLAVRTKVEPLSLAGAVRQQIWAVDKDQPVTKVRPMTDMVDDSVAVQRFATVLLIGFAGVGLLLAAVGIYGVLAYVVNQRTHEIGVRMALGAQMRDILRMVVRQGLTLVGLGLGLGLAASLALSRVVQSLLYQMSATDPLTFGVVLAVLAIVAFFACWLPARRATKVDPLVALRGE